MGKASQILLFIVLFPIGAIICALMWGAICAALTTVFMTVKAGVKYFWNRI